MKIYLDDIREAPNGWIRTYTVEETIVILKGGKVREISLDNDLGRDTLGNLRTEGRHVALWIEAVVVQTSFVPPKIWIHSCNMVAHKAMRDAVTSITLICKNRGMQYPPANCSQGPYGEEQNEN